MDIDADTGGYNLQAAFSTGFVAGEEAAKNAQAAFRKDLDAKRGILAAEQQEIRVTEEL